MEIVTTLGRNITLEPNKLFFLFELRKSAQDSKCMRVLLDYTYTSRGIAPSSNSNGSGDQQDETQWRGFLERYPDGFVCDVTNYYIKAPDPVTMDVRLFLTNGLDVKYPIAEHVQVAVRDAYEWLLMQRPFPDPAVTTAACVLAYSARAYEDGTHYSLSHIYIRKKPLPPCFAPLKERVAKLDFPREPAEFFIGELETQLKATQYTLNLARKKVAELEHQEKETRAHLDTSKRHLAELLSRSLYLGLNEPQPTT